LAGVLRGNKISVAMPKFYKSLAGGKMNRTVTILCWSAVAAWTQPAFGAILFSDDFNGNAATALNTAPIGWTQSSGTVDILLNGYVGLPCVGGTGACVDLDGSTSDAAVLTSNTTLDLTAGILYELTYFLAGSQRGDSNTVHVSFAGVTQDHTLASSAAYAQFTLAVTPGADMAAQAIVFDHEGGNNFGLLLDNVQVESIDATAVPEPAMMLLMGAALAGLSLIRRRK
jgi:hypothetical protein